MRLRSGKLLAFEVGQVVFIAVAGSLLHFAFELADYWKPLAWFAAVNESAWEHTKMYFWPGLAYALAQYTYTRGIANNYWFGKAMALLVTPVSYSIFDDWSSGKFFARRRKASPSPADATLTGVPAGK